MLRFPRTAGARLEEHVSCLSSVCFTRHIVNRDVRYGWPSGRTGDEWAHVIGTQTPSAAVRFMMTG
jgi:hypothetical protein